MHDVGCDRGVARSGEEGVEIRLAGFPEGLLQQRIQLRSAVNRENGRRRTSVSNPHHTIGSKPILLLCKL